MWLDSHQNNYCTPSTCLALISHWSGLPPGGGLPPAAEAVSEGDDVKHRMARQILATLATFPSAGWQVIYFGNSAQCTSLSTQCTSLSTQSSLPASHTIFVHTHYGSSSSRLQSDISSWEKSRRRVLGWTSTWSLASAAGLGQNWSAPSATIHSRPLSPSASTSAGLGGLVGSTTEVSTLKESEPLVSLSSGQVGCTCLFAICTGHRNTKRCPNGWLWH